MITRIIGILVLIAGIVMMFVSNYIYDQIGEGNRKIENAQRNVDTGESLLKLTPVTKAVGKQAMSPIQEKINEGRATIEEYEILAHRLQVWGIVLIIAGAVIFLLSFVFKKKKRSR